MSIAEEKKAPYTTTVALTTVMDWFRERTPAGAIDPEVVIRVGVTESLATRTVRSLMILGLIDENREPSQQWIDMASIRGDEEYKTRLQEWLRGTYSEVLTYCDPTNDPYDRVSEAFRGYEPKGQRAAMAALFLGLWRYAGLESPVPSTVPQSPYGPKKKKSTPSGGGRQGAQKPESKQHNQNFDELPPGLVGLLRQIPRGGQSWTDETRSAFLDAFTAVLNFTVPIGDPAQRAVDPETERDD